MAYHPSLTDLSHELLCHILQYLPLKEVLSISMLCKKLLSAVDMHLRLRKYIDFCEGKIYGYMPSSITDDHMHSLFKKCPHLETVYGLHPLKVERRRLRKRSALTVPGIIEALSLCCNLKSVETSDLRLFEAIMQHLPKLEIIGHFRNRDGVFPPHASQRLKLQPYPRISSLHLIGVEVPELTAMPRLEHLHLQCVRFTKLQPFRAFLAQNLKTFVMKHCMGPSLALRYLSLIIALSSSPALSRLELVRVPLPGGLFQRAVEDSYRHNGFVNLKTLIISGCKGVMEADLGHLMIVASKNLEKIFIQPSLTRDSLFVSLSFAQCEFPKLKTIHLGYVDKLNSSGEWSNDVLLSLGLAEVPDTPSSLTDSGMKVISQLFPNIKSMSVSNCPHLMAMDQWSPIDGEQAWKELTDLTLQRCHCLQLPSFALFLAFLPKIEVVILNDMFREPPKGCSHVGLSAGTGLGMSSAVVSNQDEHIAVQGHQQDFELQADDHLENDEMDRDFVDGDNEENPDQHIMVLQQEFFDDDRRIVPPPVRHRDNINPENRIENVQQNDPENRIRRELNDDYNVALNIEIGQESENDRAKKELLQQDSDDENLINIKIEPEGESNRSKREQLSSSSSEEDLTIDGSSISNDEVNKSLKQEECRKKKVVTYEKCQHAKECRNKCSKVFDPNQPSTSRDGNCVDCCTCVESDMEPTTQDLECSSNEGKHIKTETFVAETAITIVQSKKRKLPRTDNDLVKKHCIPSDCKNNQGSVKVGENNLDDEVFKGPLTRRRKRVLDADLKIKSSEDSKSSSKGTSSTACGHGKRFKISNSDNPKTSPNENDSSSTSSNSSSHLKDDTDSKPDTSDAQKSEEADNIENAEENPDDSQDKLKCKKHRKHKHKRCKRSKCNKPCHRRYPLTRSRRNKYPRDGHNIVSQGTQATSADIRRALRRQRSCSNRCKRRTCSGSHRRSHNHISARQQFKRPIQRKPSSELHNKSTSTSDPLMEDDAVQTLRLVSETLISLTIISCGISDIVIDHCQSMTHVEVQACRILKMFQLHYCPSLKRLNVSQCPKLALEVIIPEVLSLVATRKLLVYFEPCMQIYNPAESEKAIFSRAPLEQSIILFHDFTSNANETLQAAVKENLLRWMEIVQKLYYTPSFWLAKQKKKKTKTRESKTRYPYGHYLRRIHGVFTLPPSIDPEGIKWRYQILTNDHVFASALENISWDNGFPAPETCEAYTEDDALISMIETEFTEKNLKMRKKITSFYIPVSESNLLTE